MKTIRFRNSHQEHINTLKKQSQKNISLIDHHKQQLLNQLRNNKLSTVTFKSKMIRFPNKLDDNPGPTHYSRSNHKTSIHKSNNYNQHYYSILSHSKCLPSIPTNDYQFGYRVLLDGSSQPIKKSQQKIKQQIHSRNKYLKSFKSNQQSNIKIINKNVLKQQIQKIIMLIPTKSQQQHLPTSKTNLKILKIKKHKKLIKQQNQPSVLIGPGSYDVNIKKPIVSSKYQFFGSTTLRFQQKSIEKKQQQKNIIRIQRNTIDVIANKKKSLRKIKKNYKDKVIDNQIMPGPGQYNPNYTLIKKQNSTYFIGSQKRFSIDKVRSYSKNTKQIQHNLSDYINLRSFCELLNKRLKNIKESNKKSQKQNTLYHNPYHILRSIKKKCQHDKIQEIRAWSRDGNPFQSHLESVNSLSGMVIKNSR